MGQQHPTLATTPDAKAALVQQMLELFQQVRTAQDQKRADGDSSPVRWADLKPVVNLADFQQPASNYMDYSQALALGEQEATEEKQVPPSLGEVADDERAEKRTEEKATVKIKQDAKGNPIIVHKQPPQN